MWKSFRHYICINISLLLTLEVLFSIGTDLNKQAVSSPVDFPDFETVSMMNINNIVYRIDKNGASSLSGSPNGTAADFPANSGGLIYADGIVWGGKMTDGGYHSLRVGGTTYISGVKAGQVIFDDSEQVIGSSDPAIHRIWRVRNNYDNVSLVRDAALFYALGIEEVTPQHVQNIYNDYDFCWNNWPAESGAPYEDVDQNGFYDPSIDIPGYPGADQTIWTVTNDIALILDENNDSLDFVYNTYPLYGSEPIGLEIHTTIWGYQHSFEEPLGNMIFKKTQLIYTGVQYGVPNARIDSAYICQWSDIDLGTYTDDFVGCDPSRNIGFVYNSSGYDEIYSGIYETSIPAGGYIILQGPNDIWNDPLDMTAFAFSAPSPPYEGPDMDDYNGALQFYNLMEGYMARPEYPSQMPWVNPQTNQPTHFPLSGDPITASGWLDGELIPPDDRRIYLSSGPFEMALGDTQETIIALVGGHSISHIASLGLFNFNTGYANYYYSSDFIIQAPPAVPTVEISNTDDQIILNWSQNAESIENDSAASDYQFQGYNVYQLPHQNATQDQACKIATFDKIDLVQTIFQIEYDPETGYVLSMPVQTGSNSGLQRYFVFDWDYLADQQLIHGNEYYLAVTAYDFRPDDGQNVPIKSRESQLIPITILHTPVADIDYPADPFSDIPVTHSTGNGDGDIQLSVISPNYITGHDYQISFQDCYYYLDFDGMWHEIADTNDIQYTAEGARDCSGSTITGAAVATGNNTVDLNFYFNMVCNYNWVDGLQIDLPDDIIVNEWTAITDYSYSQDAGQNVVNMDGTLDVVSNTITWGDSARSQFGAIERDQLLTVNIQNDFNLPLGFSYQIWDDGYDGTIEDAAGSDEITELSYDFITMKYWYLDDLTSNQSILANQYIYNGIQKEAVINGIHYQEEIPVGVNANPIADGIQFAIDVNYGQLLDWDEYQIFFLDSLLHTISSDLAGDLVWYNPDSIPIVISSYFTHGWAPSARAIDTYGYAPDYSQHGTTSIDLLSSDIEIRYTGVYDPNTIPTGFGGTYHPIIEGSGSVATLVGARNYDIADHPDPNNPGNGDPFFIRIPFEIWDLETNEQISVLAYDRMQFLTDTDLYPVNMSDRTYYWILHEDYTTTVNNTAYENATSDLLTWNFIIWESQLNLGGRVEIIYPNPTETGVDTYTFSTPAPQPYTISKGDVNEDEEVNISDVVTLINHLLYINIFESGRVYYAADFNNDYLVNIADVVSIINYLLIGHTARAQIAESTGNPIEATIPANCERSESGWSIPLSIESDQPLTAIQFTLQGNKNAFTPQPSDIAIPSSHQLMLNQHSGNKATYIIFSADNSLLEITEPIRISFTAQNSDKAPEEMSLIEFIAVDINGRVIPSKITGHKTEISNQPTEFTVYPNYPNPFNPLTTIRYYIPEESLVSIAVYDILGRRVNTLVKQNQKAGQHYVKWNGTNLSGKSLPSGIYFMRIKTAQQSHTQKLTILK